MIVKKLSIRLYLLLMAFIVGLFVYSYFFLKEIVVHDFQVKENNIKKYIENSFKNLDISNLDDFKNRLDALTKNSILQGAKVELKNRVFDNVALISKVNTLDESWNIDDVSTDVKSGEIEEIKSGVYLFHPSQAFLNEDIVKIKFYAFQEDIIQNFTVNIYFAFTLGVINFESTELSSIENEKVIVRYSFDKSSIDDTFQKMYSYLLYIVILLIVVITLFFFIYYKQVIKKKFEMQIQEIEFYIDAMIHRNFQSIPKLESKIKYSPHIYEHINMLAQEFSQIVNELNITKDIIEKKEITDDLTGLPNKKWFEKDLKQMFITNKEGYIVYLKIDRLGEFAKKHGSEMVNSLVEDFSKSMQNYFINNREIQGRCYRFFGAEFALVIYEQNVEKIKNLLDEIISVTKMLDDKYYFFDNQIYYGGTPFDKYGTIESILQSAKDEYSSVYAKKQGFYKILDLSEQIEKNKELEESVKDIIQRDDFALQYIFDTYDFSATPKLLMQEISPMLIDMRTFDRFPIGVFISVAEKMDLAMEFDKLLIKKALSHIEMAELEHKIAINLSVGAISSMRFLTWLSSTLTYEKHASSLVFVSTAYNVAANFELYKRFAETARSFNIEIMIKRYDINDLSLERLKEIAPDYIRIERDYCSDIKRDSVKQHAIKQVLFIADDSNIKVLGDGVKSDLDYTTIEKLGFYGTSR